METALQTAEVAVKVLDRLHQATDHTLVQVQLKLTAIRQPHRRVEALNLLDKELLVVPGKATGVSSKLRQVLVMGLVLELLRLKETVLPKEVAVDKAPAKDLQATEHIPDQALDQVAGHLLLHRPADLPHLLAMVKDLVKDQEKEG